MKKLFKGLVCGVCALVSLFAVSCTKEVDFETFTEKAYKIQEDANADDRGHVTITGRENIENAEVYLIKGSGGEWEVKTTIDSDVASKLSDVLNKKPWAINTDQWWSINTAKYPGEWTYFIGDLLEMTNGEVTFKFEKDDGMLVEYEDAEDKFVIVW